MLTNNEFRCISRYRSLFRAFSLSFSSSMSFALSLKSAPTFIKITGFFSGIILDSFKIRFVYSPMTASRGADT